MIKAVLDYNPYLLETNILFNGKKPKVNSMVEKYQNGFLQDWVDKLPKIFYDEMNGYDFELEFSGPLLDCEEVIKSFENNNVSPDEVTVFHKNEIGSRNEKDDAIEDLLAWLSDNPNDYFNRESFEAEHESLFEDSYYIVLIQGENDEIPATSQEFLSIEAVTEFSDLSKTNLEYTPVVIRINDENIKAMQRDIFNLLHRDDVCEKQVFFLGDDYLNRNEAEKFLLDIGIKRPTIVESVEDLEIAKYLELYPMTDYVVKAIRILDGLAESANAEIEEKNSQLAQTNSKIHQTIDELDDEINKLKLTLDLFTSKEKISLPSSFDDAVYNLKGSIIQWRIRKTTITKEDEAKRLAKELNEMIQRGFVTFAKSIGRASWQIKSQIHNTMTSNYATSEANDDYDSTFIMYKDPVKTIVPDITEELLKINETLFIQEVGKTGIFSSDKTNDAEMVPVVTYYYQRWREYVLNLLDPLIQDVINNHYNSLTNYYIEKQAAYKTHLQELIDNKSRERKDVAQQLSKDEKKLHEDSEWIETFRDQLKTIKRG